MKSYYERNRTMDRELCSKIYRINCVTEDIDSLYHQAALKFGISDSALFILYMVYINGGTCLLSEIYKLYGISKQTINSAVRKLEKEDIVYLEKHSGKSKIVCLTENGKVCAEKTAARLLEAECNALRDWSEEEIDNYLSLIEKHNASLRKQIENL